MEHATAWSLITLLLPLHITLLIGLIVYVVKIERRLSVMANDISWIKTQVNPGANRMLVKGH